MNIQTHGKQIDVGDALRNHVNITMTDLIEKYSTKSTDSVITFSKDRHEFLCDISTHLSTGMTAQSKGKAVNIYESFDNAVEKVDKQLRRYKRRLKNHHNERKDPIEFVSASSYVISNSNSDLEEEKESLKPIIIAEMETRIPKISVGEAVMQMELLGSNMLIFRNSSHNGINIVHLREDGNIGWVDPDFTN